MHSFPSDSSFRAVRSLPNRGRGNAASDSSERGIGVLNAKLGLWIDTKPRRRETYRDLSFVYRSARNHNTKANIEGTGSRRPVIAETRLRMAHPVVPRTAAQRPVFAPARLSVQRDSAFVQTPFPHVAGHIDCAEMRLHSRVVSDDVGAPDAAFLRVAFSIVECSTVSVIPTRIANSGPLPFPLGWQTHLQAGLMGQSAGERDCLVPADLQLGRV
jgi:hypothetical protein